MAAIAQLGERQTEDLKVPGSIPGLGMVGVCSCCNDMRGLCIAYTFATRAQSCICYAIMILDNDANVARFA